MQVGVFWGGSIMEREDTMPLPAQSPGVLGAKPSARRKVGTWQHRACPGLPMAAGWLTTRGWG